MEDREPVLKILVEADYLRPVQPAKGGTGRPPSPRYEVNPALLQKRAGKVPPPSQNSQNTQNHAPDPSFESFESFEQGGDPLEQVEPDSAPHCPF